MKHTQKMVLIPFEKYQRLQNHSHKLSDPTGHTAKLPDTRIQQETEESAEKKVLVADKPPTSPSSNDLDIDSSVKHKTASLSLSSTPPPPPPGIPTGQPISLHKVKPYSKRLVKKGWKQLWKQYS